jgi:hypothetical protein
MTTAIRQYQIGDDSQFWEFTDLGFSIEFRAKSHRWWVHELINGKSARTPSLSVTSALRVLDKPALMRWAEASGAEGGIKLERMGELEGVRPENAIYKVRELGMGMDAKRDAGAARGTLVHSVLETYGREARPPNVTDYDPEVRGYVQGLCAWLLDYSPEPVAIEQPVCSRLHGFAGRVDLFCTTRASTLELWDLKTSPTATIYSEAHLQAAAYELAGIECGFDPDTVMLLAVGADGTYTVTGCAASGDDFLAVLECSRVMRKLRQATKADEDDE